MFIDRFVRNAILSIVTVLATVSLAEAAKTDVVVLVNGDAVTGEIKALEFGDLRYSTDSMGTVSIDWEDIVSIRSDQNLQVEVTDGTSYFGKILETEEEKAIFVKTASQEIILAASEVVRITPIETSESFLSRIDGSFSFGYQTQKSSDVSTSLISADMSYRARTYLVGLKINSTITEQAVEPTSARQSVEGNFQRFRGGLAFTDWFSTWEKNDELGIRARVSLGGAYGRYFIQTNRNQLSVTAGLQGSRSAYTGEDESTTEAEGRIEIRYLHRSIVPEASLTFTSKVYPLLEDFSRYRAESDIIFRREFVKDLFLDLTLGYSYLSNPPEGGSKSDYTVATSLGYKF